jgi:hypothetical protein
MAVVLDNRVAATGAVLVRMGLGVWGVRRAASDDQGDWDEQKQEFFHFAFWLLNETVKTGKQSELNAGK